MHTSTTIITEGEASSAVPSKTLHQYDHTRWLIMNITTTIGQHIKTYHQV